MITRLWHGITPAPKAKDYLAFLKTRAVPDYRSVAGNRSVQLMHRQVGDVTHFLIITHWDSLESIAAFAGSDIEQAKYYEEDKAFLLGFETTVQHYVVEPDAD